MSRAGIVVLSLLSLLAVFVLRPSAARADILVLNDCRTLEGVLAKKGDFYVLSGPFGKLRVKKSAVWKVVEKETPWERFDRIFKTIPADAPSRFVELGVWAKSVGLKERAVKAFEAALKADPDCADARRLLGYEKINGVWLRGEELLRAKGWRKFRGEWFTGEELQAMRSVPPDEAKRRVARLLSLLDGTSEPDREKGLREVRALGPNRSRLFFLRGLADRKRPRLRRACARALADYGKRRDVIEALLTASLADGDPEVRRAALESLRDIGEPGIVHTYNRALYSTNPDIHERALDAVDFFRFKESLPHLVNVIEVHEVYTGSPTGAYFESSEIHPYIADYEGLIATQAAILDPVIKYFRTGTVLYVEVRVVEIIRRIAGVDLGDDPAAWRRWMRSSLPF